jgi:F-box and WD-40 domain protein 1/11
MSPPALTLHTDLSDDFDFIDGSPFSVQHAMTVTRPPSPSFSFDFSIVSPPSPSPDRNSFPSLPHPRHASSPSSPSSLRWLGISSGDNRYNTIQGTPAYRNLGQRSPHNAKSMKCIIPRLWGALSSQTRKGRRKATRRKAYTSMPSNISYADLLPLDGEEGELIDEACYVDSGDVPYYSPPRFAGSFPIFLSLASSDALLDFLSRLPPEIAIHLLCFLDLSSIIACQSVSRRWNTLANDGAVWRELFYRRQGWGINLERAMARGRTCPTLDGPLENPDSPTPLPDSPIGRHFARRFYNQPTPSSTGLRTTDNPDALIRSPVPKRSPSHTASPWSPEHPTDSFLPSPASLHAPLFLPWRELYERRSALDTHWTSVAPNPRYLKGHADSVYCLEFDSQRIFSGSRDQTIKAWDIPDWSLFGHIQGPPWKCSLSQVREGLGYPG